MEDIAGNKMSLEGIAKANKKTLTGATATTKLTRTSVPVNILKWADVKAKQTIKTFTQVHGDVVIMDEPCKGEDRVTYQMFRMSGSDVKPVGTPIAIKCTEYHHGQTMVHIPHLTVIVALHTHPISVQIFVS